MKKIHSFSYLAIATAAVLSPLMNVASASAASTMFKDFSELSSSLNGAFSYSKIYWTADTKITVMKAPDPSIIGRVTTVDRTGYVHFGNITENDTLSVLIEDSTATDSNGQKVDVIYRISDVVPWETGNDDNGDPISYADLAIEPVTYGSSAASHPTEDGSDTQQTELKVGDPIVMWNNVRYADYLFTVEFCKKGTYNSTSDSCTPAGITNLSAAQWDFDVPNKNKNSSGEYTKYGDKAFNGNENVRFQSATNYIYYDKNAKDTEIELVTEDGGYAITKSNGASFNGIYYGNSLFVVATGLTNSSWSYRYGGTTCGIAFMFGSAVPYEMTKPTKIVDKEKAKAGDTITYRIQQVVPDNYNTEADIITFMSLYSNYSNIANDKRYSSFTITDSFDENLIMPSSDKVTIKNESGTDVTDQFNITIDGQSFSAAAKDTSTNNLYGHTYTVTIPTTLKDDVDVDLVQNLANTIYHPTDGKEVILESNPVETEITYTVITKHVDDETGEEIADQVKDEYELNDEYETSPLKKVPDGYQLVGTPDNAKGTVRGDTTVVYRYRKVKNPDTADNGPIALAVIAIAGVMGSGLYLGLKHRR